MLAILVFIIAVATSFVVAIFWVSPAQDEYLRVYESKLGRTPLNQPGLFDRYMTKPWRWPLEMIPLWLAQLRVFTTRQDIPEVEAARRRYNRRQNIAVAVYVAGVIAILAAAAWNP